MNNTDRLKLIKQRLHDAFSPDDMNVVDESYRHRGHPGAQDGRGHFFVTIVADAFADKSLIERHRLIYAALDDLMKTDIHALRINAKTSRE